VQSFLTKLQYSLIAGSGIGFPPLVDILSTGLRGEKEENKLDREISGTGGEAKLDRMGVLHQGSAGDGDLGSVSSCSVAEVELTRYVVYLLGLAFQRCTMF
jgi:hypothetical protein